MKTARFSALIPQTCPSVLPAAESYYDASYAEVFERVTALGVNFAMAAGNDYDASMNNAWGSSDITTGTWGNDGYKPRSNPDYGVCRFPLHLARKSLSLLP